MMDDLEIIRAAFLRLLQTENKCYAGITGKVCHSHKCGCALELQSYIDAERINLATWGLQPVMTETQP